MAMIKIVAVLLLACVAFGCDAVHRSNRGRNTLTTDLEVPFKWSANFEIPHEEQRSSKLSNDCENLNLELELAVPDAAAGVEANMEAAKAISAHGGLLSRRPALSLLLSLPSAAESCEMDAGYKALAEMLAATDINRIDAVKRVRSLVHFYLQRRAQKCRPIYKQKFNELLGNLKGKTKDAFEEVKTVLANVSSLDLLEYPRPKFGGDADEFKGLPDLLWTVALAELDLQPGAIRAIAEQVHNLMKSEGKADGSITSSLKEHVFKPCERFVGQFESILVPARLDAAVKDGEQKSFLMDDEQFTRAMAQLRVCKHLIGDQKKSSQLLHDYMVVLRDREAKLAAGAN